MYELRGETIKVQQTGLTVVVSYYLYSNSIPHLNTTNQQQTSRKAVSILHREKRIPQGKKKS